MKQIIPLLLAVGYATLVIGLQWRVFTISYSRAEYERRYSQSQYVKGENKTEVMGDGDIYTYAGIRYVEGEDPTKINFEHPPLVKYLFGLSYRWFGFPAAVIFLLTVVSVWVFWQLTQGTITTPLGRGLALVIFLGHSVIYKAIPQTMLDFPMTTFLLITTWLYVRWLDKPSLTRTVWWGLFAGLTMATKYAFPLLALYVSLMVLWAVRQRLPLKTVLTGVGSVLVIYLATYTGYFLHGHSPIDFLKFEWWRWHWYQGKTDSQKWMLLSTIFKGRYPKWWAPGSGDVIVSHWNLLWPVSLMLYLVSWMIPQDKTGHQALFPYRLWVLISLAAYMIGVAEDRFLVPLIPGFALFGAAWLESLYPRLHEIIKR